MVSGTEAPATYPWSMLFEAPTAAVSVQHHLLEGPQERHRHEFFEAAFVLGGQGEHATEKGGSRLRRGDVVTLLPGAWHAYRRCRALEVVNCCVPPFVLRHELGWLRTHAGLGRLLWPTPDDGPIRKGRVDEETLVRFRALLEQIQATAGADGGAARAEVVGLLTILLARLAAVLGVEDDRSGNAVPQHVLAGVRMLEAEPARRWNLRQLAAALHVNESHLVRLFSTHIGTPPMAYLARYRAELAAMLLRQSDAQVSVVGARVGWPDPSCFARRFRQHFGVSPTAYRNHIARSP